MLNSNILKQPFWNDSLYISRGHRLEYLQYVRSTNCYFLISRFNEGDSISNQPDLFSLTDTVNIFTVCLVTIFRYMYKISLVGNLSRLQA